MRSVHPHVMRSVHPHVMRSVHPHDDAKRASARRCGASAKIRNDALGQKHPAYGGAQFDWKVL